MNFSQLEYLVSLNKLKHFGRAAKENYVTQPTLSMMIKKLEEELGVEIFDRSANPLRTTTLGRQIVEQAKVVLSERKKLEYLAMDELDSFEGEMALAVIPTLAPYLLPIILPLIQSSFPKLSLTIIEATTERIISEIIDSKIDCAILATPISNDDISENHLFQEAFYLYSDNDQEFQEINPLDINMDRLILLEEGHCLRSQAINLCDLKAKHRGNTNYKIGSIETVINLVNQNQGSTIIPELAIHQLSEQEKMRLHSLKAPVPVRQISLVHHYTYHKKKLIEQLIQQIANAVKPFIKTNSTSKVIPI